MAQNRHHSKKSVRCGWEEIKPSNVLRATMRAGALITPRTFAFGTGRAASFTRPRGGKVSERPCCVEPDDPIIQKAPEKKAPNPATTRTNEDLLHGHLRNRDGKRGAPC